MVFRDSNAKEMNVMEEKQVGGSKQNRAAFLLI